MLLIAPHWWKTVCAQIQRVQWVKDEPGSQSVTGSRCLQQAGDQ